MAELEESVAQAVAASQQPGSGVTAEHAAALVEARDGVRAGVEARVSPPAEAPPPKCSTRTRDAAAVGRVHHRPRCSGDVRGARCVLGAGPLARPGNGAGERGGATVEHEGALGVQDRFLLQALKGWKTDVTIETTRDDRPTDHTGKVENMIVGMYDGSQVDATTGQTSARNLFNLRHAQVFDRIAGASVGGSVAHEIIEAYAGARAFPGKPIRESFNEVHEATAALDIPSRRKWTSLMIPERDTGRVYLTLLADSDRSSPGFESRQRLYEVPNLRGELDANGTPLLYPDGNFRIRPVTP